MRPAIYPCVSWLLLLSVTLAVAEEPQKSSPRDEYEALVTAQRDAEREFSRAYQAATTKEEKDRVSQGLGRQSSAQSHSDGFWKLIEKHPNDPVAIDTLMWLISRDNLGASTTAALGNFSPELMQNDRMLEVCTLLGHGFTDRPGEDFLRQLIAKSPHRQVQGEARFAQALRLKRQLDRQPAAGPNGEMLARTAEQILNTVIEKYGDVKHYPSTLKEAAEGTLFEMKFLGVGSPVPEIDGEDLDGKPLKLSDFRGKVVLLDFWGTWCGFCIADVPKYQKLLQRLAGKPFVILGIDKDSDRDAARKLVAEKGMSWQSWWDGEAAPITSQWNVQSWPTLYLIDAAGVIRYKGDVLRSVSVRKNAAGQNEQYDLIDERVDLLIKEALASDTAAPK